MDRIMLYILGSLFVFPAYFMGLYFIFLKIQNEMKKETSFNKDVTELQAEISDLKRELSYIEKENIKAKVELKEKSVEKEEEVKKTLEDSHAESRRGLSKILQRYQRELEKKEQEIKTEVSDTVQRIVSKRFSDESRQEQMKLNQSIEKTQRQVLRNQIDIDRILDKVKEVMEGMVEHYFMEAYYNNFELGLKTNKYWLPVITPEVRKNDVLKIFSRFRNLISEDLRDDLGTIYNLDHPDTEAYLVSRYLAPMYNNHMERLLKEYRENITKDDEKNSRITAALAKAYAESNITLHGEKLFNDERDSIEEKDIRLVDMELAERLRAV